MNIDGVSFIHFDKLAIEEFIESRNGSRTLVHPKKKRRTIKFDGIEGSLMEQEYREFNFETDGVEKENEFITIINRDLSISGESPVSLREMVEKCELDMLDNNTYEFTSDSVKLGFDMDSTLLTIKNKSNGKMKSKLLLSVNVIDDKIDSDLLFNLRSEFNVLNISSSKNIYHMLEIEGPLLTFKFDIMSNWVHVSIHYKIKLQSAIKIVNSLDVMGKLAHLILLNSMPLPLRQEEELERTYNSETVNSQLFYKCISESSAKKEAVNFDIDIPELETNLLKFQKKTVLWMLKKEGMEYDKEMARSKLTSILTQEVKKEMHNYLEGQSSDAELIDNSILDYLNALCFGWSRISMHGEILWFNKYSCNLIRRKKAYAFLLERSDAINALPEPAKGLLSEEMGLGKTVEVTALIILNPRPLEDSGKLMRIKLKPFGDAKTVIKAKSNLIIAPESIIKQWVNEIMHLAPSLAVTIYQGIDKYPKLEHNAALIAEYLRKFDIVFTTYSVISKELDYALYSSRNKLTRNGQKRNQSTGNLSDTENDLEGTNAESNFMDEYKLLFQLSLQHKKPEIANKKTNENQVETDFELELQDEIRLAMKHNKVAKIYRHNEYESPLMLTQFWRVILDEVQMVSSRLSRAFQSAALIPRYHSWGVSGTPIKKGLPDLHSILKFLKVQPFIGDLAKNSWSILTQEKNYIDFVQLWKLIALRHTKAMVHDDIKLPPQTRVLLKIPFNPVEQENYNQAFEECLAAICLDSYGNPVLSDWEPSPMILAFMRSWLVRLRQLCCNPQIGKLNISSRQYRSRSYMSSRFVSTTQHLKTLEDVLDDMLSSTKELVTNSELTLVNIYIEVAQFFEYTLSPEAAFKILQLGIGQSQKILARLCLLLSDNLASFNTARKDSNLKPILTETEIDDDDSKNDNLNNEEISNEIREKLTKMRDAIRSLKMKIRTWKIILHKLYFLLASCHFQCYDEEYNQKIERINNNVLNLDTKLHGLLSSQVSTATISTLITGKPESENENYYKAMFADDQNLNLSVEDINVNMHKELESFNYELAENIRRELLKSSIEIVKKIIKTKITSRPRYHSTSDKFRDFGNELLPKSSVKFFDKLPYIEIEDMRTRLADLRSTLFIEKLSKFSNALNEQAELLNNWMANLVELLCSPLLTADQTPAGDEYERSIEDQDKVACYLHAISKVLLDRKASIEGTDTTTKVEVVRKEKNNIDIQVHDEEFLNFLLSEAEKRRIKRNTSLNDFLNELKDIEQEVNDSSNLSLEIRGLEVGSLQEASRRLRNISSNQKVAQVLFSKDLNSTCNSIFNARIEYFKQLQQISDTVKAPEYPFKQDNISSEHVNSFMDQIVQKYSQKSAILGRNISKLRYLQTLSNGFDSEGTYVDDLTCIICRSTITIGSLTQCGHKYCKECLELWLKSQKVCPMCKTHIEITTVYNFTHHKPDIKANAVVNDKPKIRNENIFMIYKPLEDNEVEKIQKMQLKNSYSSKVDLIVKHVLYLKSKDPKVQIVIFSQWQDLLYIIGTALISADISFLGSYGTLVPEVGSGRRSNKYESVEKFKDPKNNITCFLLNAKAQASGLNLINATHIFLCEPLVNTSLELQAISRIHRIGQIHQTTVWMFIIENTVEENIVLMSTNKRLAYFEAGFSSDKNSNSGNKISLSISNSREKNLSKAESMTLMKAEGIDTLVTKGKSEGESVANNDLWNAFFCSMAGLNKVEKNPVKEDV